MNKLAFETANLSGLQSELKLVSAKNKVNRIEFNKDESVLVRIIPVPLNSQGLPWAMFSQHWFGKGRVPVACKEHTAPDFGGDTNYSCPLCAGLQEAKNSTNDKDIRNYIFGFEHRVSYRLFVLKYATQDSEGNLTECTDGLPYELNLGKPAFASFLQKLSRPPYGKTAANPMGFIDDRKGTALWIGKDAQNHITFDLDGTTTGPLFNEDVRDEELGKLFAKIKKPTFKFFDDDRMQSITNMILENDLGNLTATIKDGYSYKPQNESTTPIRTASLAGAEAEAEAVDEEIVVEAPVVVQPKKTIVQRPVVTVAKAPAQVEEDNSNPELAPVEQEEAPVITTQRTVGAVLRPAVATVRRAAPPTPPARRVIPSVAPAVPAAKFATESVNEEEDTVPEEASDPAPVVNEEIPAEVSTTVVAKPSAGGMPAALRAKIGSLKIK